MPYKRKTTKRFYKKKPMARKYKPKTQITKFKNNCSLGLGFPKKVTMTHRYSALVNLVAVSSTAANYIFSCNGMYDPDIFGFGHQPYCFDQLGAIYRHYTVIGSKIAVRAVPFTATSESWQISLAQNDDTSILSSSPNFQSEYSTGSQRLIPANSNSRECTLKSRWSAKKTFGGSILGNDDLQGTTSANPVEQTFYVICLRPTDSTSTVSVYLQVMIEYIAVWDELQDFASS